MPFSSQIVLEENMRRFDEVIELFHIDPQSVLRLFASGPNSPKADIISVEKPIEVEDILFDEIFNQGNCSTCKYRPHQLTNIAGPATKKSILSSLDTLTNQLEAKDKFRFFYTGHGLPGSQKFDRNSMAVLEGTIEVGQFTEKLDQIPIETEVQILMVQCYSGGFSLLNYRGAHKTNDHVSQANRCGFFSQLPERPAAGCSPDIQQREEYSNYFFSAYLGKSADGKKVDSDFNRDGAITSDEAHAFVIINEKSIDVPVSTSSQLLRDFLEPNTLTDQQQSKLQNILALMSDSEIAVFTSITKELNLNLSDLKSPLKMLETKISEQEEHLQALQKKYSMDNEQYEELSVMIHNDFVEQNLGFGQLYKMNSNGGLIPTDPDLIVRARKALLSHQLFPKVKSAYLKVMIDQADVSTHMHVKAKWERLMYVLQTKILEQLLEKSKLTEVKAKYQTLKSCESQPFFRQEKIR